MSFVFRMEKGEALTYAEADANNRAVLRYAGESSDAADRSIAAAKSAETLLAMTSGQAGFPTWAKAGAPLLVNNTETGPVFSDRVLNNGIGIRPALNFDFVNQGALDPRISFTRASRDFRDGKVYEINEPVITKKGLWIYGERANLLLWRNDFSHAVWVKNRVTVSLDGGFSRISATGETGLTGIRQDIPAEPDRVITLSVDLKKNSGIAGMESLIYANQVNGGTAIGFDTFSGEVFSRVAGSGYAPTVQDLGDAYRVSITTKTIPDPSGSINFSIFPLSNIRDSRSSPISEGVSVSVREAQYEASADPTPSIPTEQSQVTVARVSENRINIQGGLSNKLSIYVDVADLAPITNQSGANTRRHLFSSASGASAGNARVFCYVEGSAAPYSVGFVFFDKDSSSPQTYVATTVASLKRLRVGVAIKNGRLVWAVNGDTGGIDIEFDDKEADSTTLRLGYDGGSIRYLRGYMNAFRIYEEVLSEQQLQELTQ